MSFFFFLPEMLNSLFLKIKLQTIFVKSFFNILFIFLINIDIFIF
jgi:hypothetical protein